MTTARASVMTGVLLLMASRVCAGDGNDRVLTLMQAVKEALAKNGRVLGQQDTVTQAALASRLARNAFRPKVIPNALGSFGQTDIDSQTYRVDLSQKFTTGTRVAMGLGTSTAQIPAVPGTAGGDIHFYNADTTITLSQPLLRGFGSTVARRPLMTAELRQEDADRQRVLIQRQVALEVSAAYYRLVAQQTMIEVSRQALARARRLRDASEAKLDAGLVSQLDSLRAQELATQAELQLFDAQSDAEDARDQLAILMGRDGGESFEVDRAIPEPGGDAIDVDRAIALAVDNRPDLHSAMADRDDAGKQVSFMHNQLLPQLDVNLAWTRRETAGSFRGSFGLDHFKFATFFTVSTPVDRTSQLVDYQNALIDRNRRDRDVLTMQRQIAGDVRRALRERDRLSRTRLASVSRVEIARKEVEVAQLRYERGLSNNLDVITAEGNLLAAEGRRIQALADSAVAELSLRAILGILDPMRDVGAAGVVPGTVDTK